MWTLIGIGVAAAFGYSVVATVAPDLFPDSFREHGRVGVYFEAAAVIVSLTLLGQLLELRARSKTSAAIKSLLGLAPKTARRVKPDGAKRTLRWITCTWVICFAYDRARRCRSMGKSSKAAPVSMSRC
jgi:cation transport ATPase